MSSIVLDGILENIASRADGSIKLTFGTQEVSPTQAGVLFSMRGKYAKCMLSDENISELAKEEINSLPLTSGGGKNKTPSQRLRGVLYRYWEGLGSNGDFEEWYLDMMEKIIDFYKQKI